MHRGRRPARVGSPPSAREGQSGPSSGSLCESVRAGVHLARRRVLQRTRRDTPSRPARLPIRPGRAPWPCAAPCPWRRRAASGLWSRRPSPRSPPRPPERSRTRRSCRRTPRPGAPAGVRGRPVVGVDGPAGRRRPRRVPHCAGSCRRRMRRAPARGVGRRQARGPRPRRHSSAAPARCGPTWRLSDSFFDLGGHSLLAARLMAQVEKHTGAPLPLAALLDAPTVE
jgi:hypothetical protein